MLDIGQRRGVIDSLAAVIPVWHAPLARGLIDEDQTREGSIAKQLNKAPDDCAAKASTKEDRLLHLN